jgi:glucosamine--fructose-6-phosphate aminotransferase (isomerizing)
MTIGIINVVDSMIAREVDCGIYCNTGREMGVASTKAFTNQVICLSLLSIWFTQIHNKKEDLRQQMISDLYLLSNQYDEFLKQDHFIIKKYVQTFSKYQNLILLGKSNDEIIAKEASLKIKEMSYIHCEAFSLHSLKHGPFALLDKYMPVFLISTNQENHNMIENCFHEIQCRDSFIFVITNYHHICFHNNNTIFIPYNKTFHSLLAIIPFQLIAYYLSISKNINPDQPRNLAKVVTVL